MAIEPPSNFGAQAGESDQNRHRECNDDYVAAGLVAPKALEQAYPVRPGNYNARNSIEARAELHPSAHGSTCIVLPNCSLQESTLQIISPIEESLLRLIENLPEFLTQHSSIVGFDVSAGWVRGRARVTASGHRFGVPNGCEVACFTWRSDPGSGTRGPLTCPVMALFRHGVRA